MLTKNVNKCLKTKFIDCLEIKKGNFPLVVKTIICYFMTLKSYNHHDIVDFCLILFLTFLWGLEEGCFDPCIWKHILFKEIKEATMQLLYVHYPCNTMLAFCNGQVKAVSDCIFRIASKSGFVS